MMGFSTPAASRTSSSERYIPALTGLRALATYLVFLHHYNPATPGTLAYALFAQGYVGVSIFFVLSGFLIYHRYADAYLSRKNWSWRRYLLNRFTRIYPLYALLLLLTVGVQASLGQPMSAGLFMLNLTLLKGFVDSLKFSGLSQSWSLTIDGCFYLVAPLLFTRLQRWGAFWLTVSLLSTGLLLWAITGQALDVGNLSFLLFYTFFGRAFEFVIGMALAHQWQQNRLPFLPHASWTGLCLTATCVSWQAGLVYYTKSPLVLVISEVIFYNGLLTVGIGLFLMGLIRRETPLQRLFAHPIPQTLGRSSYAFYLIHVGVVANGLQKLGVTNHGLLFGALLSTAQGLYYFVERPVQAIINTSLGHRINRK